MKGRKREQEIELDDRNCVGGDCRLAVGEYQSRTAQRQQEPAGVENDPADIRMKFNEVGR